MGNQFAILRFNKIKTHSKLIKAFSHNKRKSETPNANPSIENKTLIDIGVPCLSKAIKAIFKATDVKPRSNSVIAIEAMMSFSPEMKNSVDLDEWAKASIEFLEQRFTSKAVLSAELHLDETTPHIHAIIVPLRKKWVKVQQKGGDFVEEKKWRLCCKDYLDGWKKLSYWQDEYADAMKPFGLKRGVKGSRASHKTMQQMYGLSEEKWVEIKQLSNIAISKYINTTKSRLNQGDSYKSEYVKSIKIIEKLVVFYETQKKNMQLEQDKNSLLKKKIQSLEVAFNELINMPESDFQAIKKHQRSVQRMVKNNQTTLGTPPC